MRDLLEEAAKAATDIHDLGKAGAHSGEQANRTAAAILALRERPDLRAAVDVLAERGRQVEGEGWTPEHDDAHDHGELALAASCYAAVYIAGTKAAKFWPWDVRWWKPRSHRENLVRAGALILAEIERLDRAAGDAP